MKPAPFEYVRPETLERALTLLADSEGAKVLSGGQSLVPMMNLRMAQPPVLVDINRVPGLANISAHDGWLRIGAMARHVDVKDSRVVASACPLIGLAYQHVAHETVRNRGTIGGNLAHADPSSELPAVMLVVDAEMVARSIRGERHIGAEEFFVSALTTALSPDEVLVEVRIPVQPPARRFAVEEFALRKGDLALSGAVVALDVAGAHCTDARIALFGISDRARRSVAAENYLVGRECSAEHADAAADLAVASLDFEGGPGITPSYRARLTRTLISRAIMAAWRHGDAE